MNKFMNVFEQFGLLVEKIAGLFFSFLGSPAAETLAKTGGAVLGGFAAAASIADDKKTFSSWNGDDWDYTDPNHEDYYLHNQVKQI